MELYGQLWEKHLSDKISHVLLRCHCHDIILDVRAPTENSHTNIGLYGELESVFDHFCLYHAKSLMVLISEFLHSSNNECT